LIAGLPRFHPRPPSIRPSNTGVAEAEGDGKKEPIMQMQQEPVAFNARRVVTEMLFLVAQMLVLGIGVAVAISVPIILWAFTQ
jgi:hypothetical protein